MDQQAQKTSVGVAVITHNAKHHLSKCLPPYLRSPLQPKVLVVNSSSEDGTVLEAQKLGAEVLIIPSEEFNHGITRDLARQHLGTDIVVMATPDAYPEDEHVLNRLIDPIIQGKASISYARQLPHRGASFFEAFPRNFSYPGESALRSQQDLPELGIATYFCSNSCAAYSQAALDSIGGFGTVFVGEDTLATAKLLRNGHSIAYSSKARVYHSHSYTLLQEFCRHFDTGLYRKQNAHLLLGSDTAKGMAYLRALFKHLVRHKPHLLPFACLHTAAKGLGYQLGRRSTQAPRFFKKFFSAQANYW